MPRPLDEIAAEVVATEDLPTGPERVDAIVRQLRLERPDTTARGRQRAAARALGQDPPITSEPKPSKSRRKRRRSRKRRRVPRVRVAPASTFGAVFLQMLGLVAVYWVVRSGGAVAEILDRARLAARWLFEPVGWGQRPS